MVESDDFERRLERAFDAAPHFPDEPVFTARVQGKLEARDQVRRMVMGLVGGAGAFVAAAQLVRANFGAEFGRAYAAFGQALEQGSTELNQDASALLTMLPVQGEVLWTAAGLAALAVAALAMRVSDQV